MAEEVFLKPVNFIGSLPVQIGGVMFNGCQALPGRQARRIKRDNPNHVVICDRDGNPLEEIPVIQAEPEPISIKADVPPSEQEEEEVQEAVGPEASDEGDTLSLDGIVSADEPSQQEPTLD